MKKPYKLDYKGLKKIYSPRHFKLRIDNNTIENHSIIGQERAVKAMEFGLNVKAPKYNMFLCGIKGTGKTSYCMAKVMEKAKKEKTPNDWCYVYNFKYSDEPKAISLPSGMGREFQGDIELLIMDLLGEISKRILSEEDENNKNDIINTYKEKRNKLLSSLSKFGNSLDFEIESTSSGLLFTPVKDGKRLDDEGFDSLADEEKERYEENAEKLQSKAITILKKIKYLEKEVKKKLLDFQKMIGHYIVRPKIEDLIKKYQDYNSIVEHLQDMEEDLANNIIELEAIAEEGHIKNIELKELAPRYYVNLVVDNSKNKGAPVITESNPTYNNLIGLIEYENEKGTLRTDFTMIKGGSLHRANGGYLIIQADQLLKTEYSWSTLKRILNTGEIKIESLRHQLGVTDIATLNPQSIPISFKVILIGNPYIYRLLSTYDEDFDKLFKIKVDFDTVMENNFENQKAVARFIHCFCKTQGLMEFSSDAVVKILELSNRIAGSQKKLSTRFNKIAEIITEADAWAEIDGESTIKGEHVEKAMKERKFRYSKVEENLNELYIDGKIIIDVKGKVVGKVNGLSVMDLGDYIFGKPSVITVSSYAGTKGVINIEREVEMSGNIHNKGVMILEGYLNENFCKENPLNITSTICFEQSYSGVDGDSASSTELYGILSSIGEIPIKQGIGVTGSINQKGEIQPVGSITEKVEGFFSICKHLGFTGEQGVIIPIQNVKDLVLCDEVIKGVKEEKFHIYPISTIEEGIKILTDKDFKEVFNIVKGRLEEYISNKKEKEE